MLIITITDSDKSVDEEEYILYSLREFLAGVKRQKKKWKVASEYVY